MSSALRADVLEVSFADGVATLTLNRPKARNALNMELKRALAQTLRELSENPAVRCVVITGSGTGFSAGGDVKELDASRPALTSRDRMEWLLHEVFLPLARLPIPTIAAVNGAAFGAGFSLALACDIVLAAEDAVFSLAFSRMGLIPDCGALWFLPRVLGAGRAKELLFTARRIDADEALRLGAVQRVVPASELLTEARTLASQIADGPRDALRMTKRLLEQTATSTLEEAAQLESYAQGVAMASAEHAEALAAFGEKRPPAFRDLGLTPQSRSSDAM